MNWQSVPQCLGRPISLLVSTICFLLASSLKKCSLCRNRINRRTFQRKKGVSVTAIKIAEALEVNISDINSVRAGGIVGKHEVIFGFPYQTVRLIHESISREAFGNGVIFAAQNLINKGNGKYTFEDILLPYFTLNEQEKATF